MDRVSKFKLHAFRGDSKIWIDRLSIRAFGLYEALYISNLINCLNSNVTNGSSISRDLIRRLTEIDSIDIQTEIEESLQNMGVIDIIESDDFHIRFKLNREVLMEMILTEADKLEM